MRLIKGMAALLASFALVACGGGGGNAGDPVLGGGDGSGNSGSHELTLVIQRAGTSTSEISSTETVQAVATVRSATGSPVEGVVVTFGEDGSSLLTLSPAAGTALTDSEGKASVDLRASSSSGTGATTVTASATVASSAISGASAIQITSGAGGGGTVATPAAVNFVGSVPSDTAIVIKGAGGSGRSESAILTFSVVDSGNAPISEAEVDFSINANSGGASISRTSGLTDSSGQISVTVSSGTQPASIVVTATSGAVSTQSDTLIVSNDVVLPAGFEIVSEKYNLDGRLTGDSTTITAFVRDQFGNPVADGVAVNFTSDFGVVASSTLGGCTTENGTCSVDFKVQNPRGEGIATVVGEVRIGDSTVVSDALQINMAGATGTPYLAVDEDGNIVETLTLSNTCKKTFEVFLSDGNGHAAAMGTAISAPTASAGAKITVKTGTPVLDQLDLAPSRFSIEVDLSSSDLVPACNAATGTGTAAPDPVFFRFEFKTPNNVVFSQRIELAYPH